MTLKEVLTKVMVMLDEAETTDLKQNMADYKNKIYECVDSCQRELSAQVSTILKQTKIQALDGTVTLPSDCFEIKGVYKNKTPADYDEISNREISLLDGEYTLKYNAYPKSITADTPTDYILEIANEACEALVYGVCAGLCINDEPELYVTYMDRYNGICRGIIERKELYPKARVKGGIRI